MITPHINANKDDFAKVVLMPGDPVRAKWIADTFLTDVKQVNDVRGILGFTGYSKNGKRISVMASGMGQPSIGIYSYELFKFFGVETIIRVGTCGSYQPDIDLNDIILATSASTDSCWFNQFKVNGVYSACANFDVLFEAKTQSEAHNIPCHCGNVLSSDVFYAYDKDEWKSWANLGVLAVEMESYALYTNAAMLHKKAMCILTVTDNLCNEGKLSQEERATGLYRMIEIGIATAEKFA